MFQFTVSTASSTADLTSAAAYKIPLTSGTDGPSSRNDIKSQIFRLFATTTDAAQIVAGSLILAEIDQVGAEKLARFRFVATSGSFRTNKAGSGANGYVCTVVFDESGSSKLDILGHDELVRVSSNATPRNCKTAWYIVIESGLTGSITVFGSDTRAVG